MALAEQARAAVNGAASAVGQEMYAGLVRTEEAAARLVAAAVAADVVVDSVSVAEIVLLDAEIGHGKVQHEIRHHADRRAVARPVERSLDAEVVSQSGQPQHRGQPSDVAHAVMHSSVVYD